MEWSNQYNPFNSVKGLLYVSQYEKINSWTVGKGELPPPIECNLDPIAECNLTCNFCVSQRYLRAHREEVAMRKLPTEYMLRLVEFLADWGIKGLCISGGGEPSLHDGVPQVLRRADYRGLKTSMFTNGTHINANLADAMLGCQFVDVSINAADRDTYTRIMGKDLWNTVTKNVAFLVSRKKSNTFLCARMLVLPENWHQIHEVCKWAKFLGMSAFNVRPVDFERSDIKGHKKLNLPVDRIQEQFDLCHQEETATFKVYTTTHKFDAAFHVKHDFSSCLATPLLIPILQDGNAYLCVDRKMEAMYKLGSCYPDPENILQWWGSEAHRNLIKSVDLNDCSRCTFSQYNRQMIEVVENDAMMVSFP